MPPPKEWHRKFSSSAMERESTASSSSCTYGRPHAVICILDATESFGCIHLGLVCLRGMSLCRQACEG